MSSWDRSNKRSVPSKGSGAAKIPAYGSEPTRQVVKYVSQDTKPKHEKEPLCIDDLYKALSDVCPLVCGFEKRPETECVDGCDVPTGNEVLVAYGYQPEYNKSDMCWEWCEVYQNICTFTPDLTIEQVCDEVMRKQPKVLFKAGDTLPIFSGCIKACNEAGEEIELAGEQVIPEDMIGFIVRDPVSGAVCYVPEKFEPTIYKSSDGSISFIEDPEDPNCVDLIVNFPTPEIYDPGQEIFKGGDTLPANQVDTVTVCLSSGANVTLSAGSTVPEDIAGYIAVDEVTGCAVYVPPKFVPEDTPEIVFCAGDVLPAVVAHGGVEVCLDDGTITTLQGGDTIPDNMVGAITVDPVSNKASFSIGAFKIPDPAQETFKAGDVLPENTVGSITVCLIGGGTTTVAAGDSVPANIDGCIQVDEATGAIGYFPPKLLDTDTMPEQELFKSGNTLPEDMIGTVTVCLVGGGNQILSAGGTVPANMLGCVFVDEVTNVPSFIPPKAADAEQTIFIGGDTLPTTMVGTIEVALTDGTCVTLNPGDAVPANINGSVGVDPTNGNAGFMQSPVKIPDQVQEIFKGGATMPENTAGTVTVCLSDGTTTQLAAGQAIPADIEGCIAVDELTGSVAYIPPKLLDTDTMPEQEVFKATDTIPAEMIGTVTFCVEGGGTSTIAAGGQVPANIVGCIFVDEVTNVGAYIPPKAPPKEQTVFSAGEILPANAASVEVALDTGECVTINAGEALPANISGTVAVDCLTGTSGFMQNPVKALPATQEIFKAGDTLPASLVGTVSVCTTAGVVTELTAGGTLPADLAGCVIVDEVTGVAAYVPPKFTPGAVVQELFKAGDTLPATMIGTITVCLSTGETAEVAAGDALPAEMVGCVQVDEVSNVGGYVPPKTSPEQFLFKAGDTLPATMIGTITVCLSTGETAEVSAGDPVPAELVGCVAVDSVTSVGAYVPPKAAEAAPATQELFKAGDTIPADAVGTITVCLLDGTTADITAGDPVPAEIVGCAFVDEVTGIVAYIPPKPEPQDFVFEYTDYDPALHGVLGSGTSPAVGDGTAANPYQLPRPAKIKPFVDACIVASASADMGLDQLVISDSSCAAMDSLSITSVDATISFYDNTEIALALTPGGDTVVPLTPEQIMLLNHPIKATLLVTDSCDQTNTGVIN